MEEQKIDVLRKTLVKRDNVYWLGFLFGFWTSLFVFLYTFTLVTVTSMGFDSNVFGNFFTGPDWAIARGYIVGALLAIFTLTRNRSFFIPRWKEMLTVSTLFFALTTFVFVGPDMVLLVMILAAEFYFFGWFFLKQKQQH